MFDANCRAISRPRVVTISADNFMVGVITITGVLLGSIFEVIISPAKMLPHARRLIGLITSLGVSSIGDKVLIRVVFKETR